MKNAIRAFVLVAMTFVFSAASFAQATPATPAKPATPPATEKKNETATEKSSSTSDDTGKTKSKGAKAKTKRTKKASEKSTEKMEEKKTDTMEKKTKQFSLNLSTQRGSRRIRLPLFCFTRTIACATNGPAAVPQPLLDLAYSLN